jgi:hypothetical protein
MPSALACLLSLWLTSCDPALEPYRVAVSILPPAHVQLVHAVELWDRDYGRAENGKALLLLPRQPGRRATKIFAHEVGHLVESDVHGLDDMWATRHWQPAEGGQLEPVGQTTDYVHGVVGTDGWRQAVDEDIADTYSSFFADGVDVDQGRRFTLCYVVPDLRPLPLCQQLLGAA